MDFSRLSRTDLLDFLVAHKFGTLKSEDLYSKINMDHRFLVTQSTMLWQQLCLTPGFNLENLTPEVANLYLATSFQVKYVSKDVTNPNYPLSKVLSASPEFLDGFQKLFGIPFPPKEIANSTDYEFLRERIIHILKLLNWLIDDTFDYGKHCQIWKVDVITSEAMSSIIPKSQKGDLLQSLTDVLIFDGTNYIPLGKPETHGDLGKSESPETHGDLGKPETHGDLGKSEKPEIHGDLEDSQGMSLNPPSSFSYPEISLNYWYFQNGKTWKHFNLFDDYQWINLSLLKVQLIDNLRSFNRMDPLHHRNWSGKNSINLRSSSLLPYFQTFCEIQGQRVNFVVSPDAIMNTPPQFMEKLSQFLRRLNRLDNFRKTGYIEKADRPQKISRFATTYSKEIDRLFSNGRITYSPDGCFYFG